MEPHVKTIPSGLRPPQTWTDFSYLRWTKREHVPSRMGKERFAQMLEENNLPHSRIIAKFDSAEDINLEELPESFVLKPSGLWSAKGVMLLHRISDTVLFFDAMKGSVLSQPEIVERQLRLQNSLGKGAMKLIAEERAIDEDRSYLIPVDYKIFTFFGVVKFVLQVDRNHPKPRMAFFDGDFNPIDDDRVFFPQEKPSSRAIHKRPSCHIELLQLAHNLSLQLKVPFVSIDCYATSKGPLFGELTHTPGGPWFGNMYRFSDSFDRELGTAWRAACMTLDMEIPLVEESYEILQGGRVIRKVTTS